MRQAIQTKSFRDDYSDNKRIRAKASAGSITIDWDEQLDTEANNLCAAVALSDKLDWFDVMFLAGGTLRDGSYVWVFAHDLLKEHNIPMETN